MVSTTEIKVRRTTKSNLGEVDFFNLGFGKIVTDHMFVCEYEKGDWQQPEIIPFGNISMAPTALALHYGQTVFEGMKAFRMIDGRISIFRIERHWERFNRSLRRMCMPMVPFDLFAESIIELVKTDEAWLKNIKGNSLYIRPFMFATQEKFGVSVSEEYKFMVFIGAVGEYYSKPLRVKVEDAYIRASHGGTGAAKCGGNYGGAFYPTQMAKNEGFDQIIWTDGSEQLYIEESGTMNVMFVIDGVVTTPALSDSILSGVTRDSMLKMAAYMGYKIDERKISALELAAKLDEGRVQEAFGVGTAAVTAPIISITIKGKEYALPAYTEKSLLQRAHLLLDDIRHGIHQDDFQWNTIV